MYRTIWRTFFLLGWMVLTHFFSLRIFMNGFLLTRQTLPTHSVPVPNPWSQFPIVDASLNSSFDSAAARILYKETLRLQNLPKFKRLIYVVIDALRTDFLLPINASFTRPYLNNIILPYRLHTLHPENSLLLQTRADAPTTTSQRLKALMTGSLPTFIDAGSNFASSHVEEDHLLHSFMGQLGRGRDEIVLLGDETWAQLFGPYLSLNHSVGFESLRLFDLHSVDRGITARLFPLLEDPSQKHWSVLIAHFLGVDHCGHKYGTSHQAMSDKLTEMNTVLERIVESLHEDTLLIVLGDHGMTKEGDHGGESVEEVMAGAWIYSKRPIRLHSEKQWEAFMRKIEKRRVDFLGWDIEDVQRKLNYDPENVDAVLTGQIQLVPTLAYLMGAPIPFGNLGAIIPDVVHVHGTLSANLFNLVQEIRINALQVYHYLIAYSRQSSHSGYRLQDLAFLFEQFFVAEKVLFEFVENGSLQSYLSGNITKELEDSQIEQMQNIFDLYDHFLFSVLIHCQQMWAQFDVGCMLVGIFLLGTSVLVLLLWNFGFINPSLKNIIWGALIGNFLGVFLAFGLPLLIEIQWIDGWFDKMTTMDLVLVFKVIGSLFGSFFPKVYSFSSSSSSSVLAGTPPIIILLVVTVHALTLASNSYIIFEDRVIRFICSSLVVYYSLSKCSSTSASPSRIFLVTLLTLAWIRISGLTGVCREEQYPFCSYTTSQDIKFTGVNGLVLRVLGNLSILTVIPEILRRQIMNVDKNGPKLRWVLWFLSLGGLYTGLLALLTIRWSWIVWTNSDDEALLTMIGGDAETVQWAFDILVPRLTYAGCVIGSLIWDVFIFREITESVERVRLFAWGFILFVGILLAILQRPLGGVVVLSFFVIYSLFLLDSSILSPSKSYPSTIFISLALLHFLGYQIFFTTEHQAIFPAIHWESAFIGLSDYNYYFGALLVGLTTFTGWILTVGGSLLLTLQFTAPVFSTHFLGTFKAVILFILLIHAIPTFLSAIFVAILRRHLMTWKIFAPRFLLQCILLVGVDVFVWIIWGTVGLVIR